MREVLTEDDIDEIKEVFRLNSEVDHRSQCRAPVTSIPIMLHALGIGMGEIENLDINAALYKIGIDVDDTGNGDMDSDTHGTGKKCANPITIKLSEFVQIAKPHLLNRDPVEEAEKLFELFDEEKQGFLSVQSLRRVADDVGLRNHYTDEDFKEMIQDASTGNCRDEVMLKADFVRMNMLLAKNNGYASSSSDESD